MHDAVIVRALSGRSRGLSAEPPQAEAEAAEVPKVGALAEAEPAEVQKVGAEAEAEAAEPPQAEAEAAEVDKPGRTLHSASGRHAFPFFFFFPFAGSLFLDASFFSSFSFSFSFLFFSSPSSSSSHHLTHCSSLDVSVCWDEPAAATLGRARRLRGEPPGAEASSWGRARSTSGEPSRPESETKSTTAERSFLAEAASAALITVSFACIFRRRGRIDFRRNFPVPPKIWRGGLSAFASALALALRLAWVLAMADSHRMRVASDCPRERVSHEGEAKQDPATKTLAAEACRGRTRHAPKATTSCCEERDAAQWRPAKTPTKLEPLDE